MPIVNITLIKGRTQAQKERMYREVTEALHRSVDAPKENIRIIVTEVEPEHFAVAGVPKSSSGG